jgi:MFS transporter, FSR family, fosmidomycin resistance protein
LLFSLNTLQLKDRYFVKNSVNAAVLLVAFGHFTLELCQNFLPIVYPAFRDAFSLSYAQIGLIGFVATTAGTLAQPLFGHLSDRTDSRQVAAWSVLWLGVVMGLLGFAWNYTVLLVAVALASLGSAAFHPAGATVTARSAGGSRGAAISIFSVGGNLGAALSPLLVAVGLAWFGLSGTFILAPVAVVAGLLLIRGLRHNGFGAAISTKTTAGPGGRGFALGLALVVLAASARSWFQFTWMTYLPTWLESHGHSVIFAGQMLFLFSFSTGLGSLVGGWLSDRVGRWQVLLVSLLLLGPIFWLYLQVGGAFQIVLTGVQGFLLGCTYPVAVVLAQEVWPSGMGMASGLVMGIGWWPGGIGAQFTGWLADRTSLDAAFQTLVFPPFVGFLCMVAFVVAWRQTANSRTGEASVPSS